MGKTIICLALLAALACAPAAAGSKFADGLGDATGPLVGLGIAATFFGSGDNAKNDAVKVGDAAVVSVGLAELLKPNLKVENNGYNHSFPSGHTAIAFGTATALAELHPKQKWLYYAGAALLGWSRVESDAHTWKDVLGGAALGIGAGRLSMTSDGGLMFARIVRF